MFTLDLTNMEIYYFIIRYTFLGFVILLSCFDIIFLNGLLLILSNNKVNMYYIYDIKYSKILSLLIGFKRLILFYLYGRLGNIQSQILALYE